MRCGVNESVWTGSMEYEVLTRLYNGLGTWDYDYVWTKNTKYFVLRTKFYHQKHRRRKEFQERVPQVPSSYFYLHTFGIYLFCLGSWIFAFISVNLIKITLHNLTYDDELKLDYRTLLT